MYHQEGGRILDESGFGEDPLQGDNAKTSVRAQAFNERYPSYDAIFHEVVNMNPTPFKNAILMLPIVCPNHNLETTNNIILISKQFRVRVKFQLPVATQYIIIGLLYL